MDKVNLAKLQGHFLVHLRTNMEKDAIQLVQQHSLSKIESDGARYKALLLRAKTKHNNEICEINPAELQSQYNLFTPDQK